MNEKPQVAIIGLSGQSIFLHVDHFHKQGETLVSDDFFMEPGGKGFNQAVALKRLGAGVSFLSAVGNDDYGKKCHKTLLDLGMETSFMFKDNQQTALASILTNLHGETKVTVFLGAKLVKDDVEQFSSSINKAAALLIQLEVPDEVLIEAINI
ncbi:MAG: PfkB family carbohydrate kinase, partial [Bacilli bacterium]